MRIKSLELKYRNKNVIIKINLNLLNACFTSFNYLNNLNFLLSLLSFNNFIKKFII